MMRLACDVFQCSLSARARENDTLVESCRCSFLSPVPSSVQSFPIRPFPEWVVVGNLFLKSEAVASLMYYPTHELRYRYAQSVGPLFNERFILRFEIEIYSDRHFRYAADQIGRHGLLRFQSMPHKKALAILGDPWASQAPCLTFIERSHQAAEEA
jgi:hypothetical protein